MELRVLFKSENYTATSNAGELSTLQGVWIVRRHYELGAVERFMEERDDLEMDGRTMSESYCQKNANTIEGTQARLSISGKPVRTCCQE